MSARSAWSETQREIQEKDVEIERLKALITELIASIVDLQHPYAEHAYDELLQRAREATQ